MSGNYEKKSRKESEEMEINSHYVPLAELDLAHLFRFLAVSVRHRCAIAWILARTRHSQDARQPVEKHHSNLK
jgi:hypothetical protein